MTTDQIIVFSVLGAALVLFVWNRWRYDIVALGALLVVALTGLVPPDEVFMGLGHPAVITVAAVLVISRGLENAGVVDMLARFLTKVGDRPWVQVGTMTGIVALCSGFMNNVGALALLMPVAIWMARKAERSPSFLLMPLAFGSLLGGTITLIGTPPNIIIATYRVESGAEAFGMFDFLPVGLGITAAGVVFITLIGWQLTPQRQQEGDGGGLFEIEAYLSELRVPEGCKFARKTLHDLVAAVQEEADVLVIALVRGEDRKEMPSTFEVLREGDVLLVEADSNGLKALVDITGLKMVGDAKEDEDEEVEKASENIEAGAVDVEGDGDAEETEEKEQSKKAALTLEEAIVTPGSMLVGTTLSRLDLRERYGVNVLAAARQGHRLREQLGKIRFSPGDILLVQGDEEQLQSRLNTLGCLPLASRGLRIGRPRKVLLAGGIFAAALALVALNQLPAAIALVSAAMVMVLVGLISPGEVYKSIDMPVILLLGAMLPVGQALENTGGSQLIADALLRYGATAAPAITLAVLMLAVMFLSNIINNAAAAVLAAPIALSFAEGLERSADPFLMAVAIGASCAFITPIGHQSNTLVMAPGGYKFGDYWRMGLPLSLLVVACAVPLILWVWPL